MLKAIIFDCDGVIADTEPIHMAAFGRVLEEQGITLVEEDYFNHYLALDDRGCFIKAFAAQEPAVAPGLITEMIGRKAGYVERAMKANLRLMPGALELIRRAAECYPLAIASGALRAEIELILSFGGLSDCFHVVVSAEDVARSKPDPDPFMKALELLNLSNIDRIEPGECLVIEDSIHGIRAAHQAAMPCLAVTNSYPGEKLSAAERVVDSLEGLSLQDLESLFEA